MDSLKSRIINIVTGDKESTNIITRQLEKERIKALKLENERKELERRLINLISRRINQEPILISEVNLDISDSSSESDNEDILSIPPPTESSLISETDNNTITQNDSQCIKALEQRKKIINTASIEIKNNNRVYARNIRLYK